MTPVSGLSVCFCLFRIPSPSSVPPVPALAPLPLVYGGRAEKRSPKCLYCSCRTAGYFPTALAYLSTSISLWCLSGNEEAAGEATGDIVSNAVLFQNSVFPVLNGG